MIDEYRAKLYCKENISKIKNYDKAIADTTQVWHCHHMTETWWNCTKKDLIKNECYYNRKACELIFLTKSEHSRLHRKGKILSKEHRRKICESHKGLKQSEETCIKISESLKGKPNSIFGKAFKERYGMTNSDNRKLYSKEYIFYKRHGHFSWEVN